MSIKTSPFAATPADAERIKSMAAAFGFDEVPAVTTNIIVIAGPEGSGKTHLACTMAEVSPVYIVDTEYRAGGVVKKFGSYPNPVKHKVCSNYEEIVIAVKAILSRAKPGVIVLDSGSDLQLFAEIAYLKRTKMEKIYPAFNWSEVWTMCSALIDDIKFSPFTLVVTARVKEEYVKNEPTGRTIPRVYNTLPYKADAIIQFKEVHKPGWLVKPQSLEGKEIPITRDLSLPKISEYIESLKTKGLV